MKKGLLLFLLLYPVFSTFSQSKIQPVFANLEIGTDFRTNTPLMGRELSFGMPIYNLHQLSDESFAVMLRKKNPNKKMWTYAGEVLTFNPVSEQIKWQKKFKYAQSCLIMEGNVMLQQRGNKLERLNPDNGMPLWKSKGVPFKIFPELGRALCYNLQEGGYQLMQGVDLENGKSVWSRNVPGSYGWENLEMLDHETALIKSSGLHLVKISDGYGWDIDRVSHAEKVDMKKVGLAVLTGVALGAASGALGGAYYGYAVPYSGDGYTNMFLEISSNPVYNNDTVFLASKNRISCHSMDGKTFWTSELNDKQTSKSHLFKEGNVLYLINHGYAIKFGIPASFGTPFIAAFDASTGQQLFMKVWGERKNYFTDYMVQGNELYLLYRDKLEIHEFSPEGLTKKNTIDRPEGDKMHSFISDELFSKKDSVFTQLSLDNAHYYILTEAGEILQFNNDLTFLGQLDKNSIHKSYFENIDFRFLGNDKETFIVSKADNLPVAHCEIPATALLLGRKLYYRKPNLNMVAFDLQPFMSTIENSQGSQPDH
ncbi:hypothetical protein [Dyadobacter sp. CY356]|uniref:hypothetical protein n=1 Tax=Dyadobacter sp. CY356 TaxID=2906442 RepID=UPI001F2B977E|nr:hypothetical protein [Dyadobacter sp. CY356]MCF0055066.1 hypothetical protein [Dyadobacter sp. CY356]